jgi:hypothetical protein
MSTALVVLLVNYLCPDFEAVKPEYNIQGETVNCMDYYTNDIINNPNNYKTLVEYVKNR